MIIPKWSHLFFIVFFVTACDRLPLPFGEGPDVVLDFPVLERHWDPDTQTLYVSAKGSETDLHRHIGFFNSFSRPVKDLRFHHTSTTLSWWTPPASPSITLGHATIDHPPTSPDQKNEYEFVITADRKHVYYEQRILPPRSKSSSN